jgi:hypothetical protein
MAATFGSATIHMRRARSELVADSPKVPRWAPSNPRAALMGVVRVKVLCTTRRAGGERVRCS